MRETPPETLPDLRDALARRAVAAALDPVADPKLLPQFIGVAVRALAIAGKDPRSAVVAARPIDPATEDHPDLPRIPEVLPGPPWDPFRDASPEQQEAWNDELIARRIVHLVEEAADLSAALDRPDLIAQVEADLRHVRAGGDPAHISARYVLTPGPSPSPARLTEDGEL